MPVTSIRRAVPNLVALLCVLVGSASADAVDPLAPWVDAIAARLDPRVSEGLASIDGSDRRLLALRSYLRSGRQLGEHWSWTEAEIEAYRQTRGYRELQDEIERVRSAFAAANPGYELWVNPQVRSLDVQVRHWNENASVREAAATLAAATRSKIAEPSFGALSPEAAVAALEKFLRDQTPSPTPTIAAPGLSPHGQLRAVDFQVWSNGSVVAGADTGAIAEAWDAAGWTARLEAAVRTASPHFVGPLATPREPWHYTYAAERLAGD